MTVLNNDASAEHLEIMLPISAQSAVNLLNGEDVAVNNGRLQLTIGANDGAVIKLNA